MSKHNALIVFGSGPGIGRNVAALFAERGFGKIILLSRDTNRMKEDAVFVQKSSTKASVATIPIDLADTQNVRRALGEIDRQLSGTPLEAVLFNAARVGASKMFEFAPEQLEADLRISVVSLYTVAQWALPQLVKVAEQGSHSPAFLVTSGLLYKDPFPALFSLATGKAAQYNLVQSLHKEFELKGVHCALIVVGGRVADESEVTNARNVAEEAWKLYSQPKGKGDLDVVMLDPAYQEHIRKREQENRS
ncbi:Hypothetical predicted protein [Lecanosticta acicola]|uniref:NAD(P)-binding protein n=1 Tax=Lecanosticta acicola TaxID=111012 RepID=A0AAI9E996_9PEZI|nr:Hypothetical predicted protein [Lecanosticta acicola]